jgi:hypothetical protein
MVSDALNGSDSLIIAMSLLIVGLRQSWQGFAKADWSEGYGEEKSKAKCCLVSFGDASEVNLELLLR